MAEPRPAGYRFIYHIQHFLVQGLVEGEEGGEIPDIRVMLSTTSALRSRWLFLSVSVFRKHLAPPPFRFTRQQRLIAVVYIEAKRPYRHSLPMFLRDVVVLFSLNPARSCLARADRQERHCAAVPVRRRQFRRSISSCSGPSTNITAGVEIPHRLMPSTASTQPHLVI